MSYQTAHDPVALALSLKLPHIITYIVIYPMYFVGFTHHLNDAHDISPALLGQVSGHLHGQTERGPPHQNSAKTPLLLQKTTNGNAVTCQAAKMYRGSSYSSLQ